MDKKARNIGLNVTAPKGTCEDAKCPFHGTLPVRGRVFVGTVKSTKASKTAVVQWLFLKFLPKYERYERTHTRVVAHNPDCLKAKVGDKVKISECRPISKSKRFVLIEVL